MSTRNIGIFAHVDAGKTTLSEQLLVHSGRIREAGSVDRGTAHTDDLPVERRRGISVRATCVSLEWKGTSIQLIDTPGHTDFSAEIERSFWALDAAVLVVDAAQGVQPQTETLFRALRNQRMPFLFFLNKTDREEADPDTALKQIRKKLTPEVCPLWNPEELTEYLCGTSDELMVRYLDGETIPADELQERLIRLTASGEACPALCGSALHDRGIAELLDAMVTYLPGPETGDSELCAVAFAAARDRSMGRGLWTRMFGGRLENRMTVELRVGTNRVTGEPILVQRKISQIRNAAGEDTGVLSSGEVGIVYGLGDLEIGHVFGNPEKLPRKVQPGTLKTPLMMVRALPEKPEEMQRLREACAALSSEDPLLEARYVETTGEMVLRIMGRVQLEILEEMLKTRFGLTVSFGEPAVIYRETIRQRATGFVAYTMPKPCWAILQFYIRPGKRGSGVQYHSEVPVRKIQERYQHQVEQALPIALSQGRMGWEVTDVDITLVDGSDHQFHTHPLDFILATPMGIQDGLRNCGTCLLEPILRIRFLVPLECAGRVMSDIQIMRGQVLDSQSEDDRTEIVARVPAAECYRYMDDLASLTGGRGSMNQTLDGYELCPPGKGSTTPRRGVDPLDTAKYILSIRNATQG